MEELKPLIPVSLKRSIYESVPENLLSTCSSLLDFFLHLPQFQRVVRELSDREMALCGKNKASALDFKRKGNDYFSRGDFTEAISSYTQALRFAPMDIETIDKNMVATIYVNRASSMHKMGLLEESIRDCNRAITLSPCYAKAWYRRGQANASLEKCEDAIHNLNVALNMEKSLPGKSRIKGEIELMLKNHNKTLGTISYCQKDLLGSAVELLHTRLECVSTPEKGRGMISSDNIPPASLLHSEKPYAAVILKQFRESHCHFCFSELPIDAIPCSSCTIPLYCSLYCQEEAGGNDHVNHQISYFKNENISVEVERYITEKVLGCEKSSVDVDRIPEHRNECGGAPWPAVLPPEIVLAGRVLVKSLAKERCPGEVFNSEVGLELSHNYALLPGESKLELHVYSVVLTYCLQHSIGSDFPLNGTSVSRLVILISQININSMAVVHMKSVDAYVETGLQGKLSATEDAVTSCVEQVRIAQAIYTTGSMFNHSCLPNIHAYFISRTLFIRSTEFVSAGFPLELSYGPQVGQWDRKDRQRLLEERYMFECHCRGCSKLNLSDLVIHGFRCVKPDCFGAVLETNSLKDMELSLPVGEYEREDIHKVARLLLEQTDGPKRLYPGYCLTCGFYPNWQSLHVASKKVSMNMKRLKDAIILKRIPTTVLSDALEALNLLRSTMHPYNKDVAQAEDNLAEAFCLMGEFQHAIHHCKASIEILEKLYHTNHIVIGNELMKLASIQLSSNNRTAATDTITMIHAIFQLYYGSHTVKVYPYFENLKRQASKLTLQLQA